EDGAEEAIEASLAMKHGVVLPGAASSGLIHPSPKTAGTITEVRPGLNTVFTSSSPIQFGFRGGKAASICGSQTTKYEPGPRESDSTCASACPLCAIRPRRGAAATGSRPHRRMRAVQA